LAAFLWPKEKLRPALLRNAADLEVGVGGNTTSVGNFREPVRISSAGSAVDDGGVDEAVLRLEEASVDVVFVVLDVLLALRTKLENIMRQDATRQA